MFRRTSPRSNSPRSNGAIAFYLDHQAEVDEYLVDTEREFEGNAILLEQASPALNDLRFGIVKAVRRREPKVDFLSAQEAGLDGVPDPVLLDRAAAEGRVLVS